MKTRLTAICCFIAGLFILSSAPVSRAAQKNEKLKPEELIAKHLDSIGSVEKRKAVKSRTTSGSAQVAFRVGGSGSLNGKANVLSQGNSVRLGFTFPALEYPGEQLAFDGNKVTAGQSSPGNYPPFSGFVYENDMLMKEGLLFGTLSTGWALFDVTSRKPKLDLSGLKKVDGKQLYELKYQSRSTRVNMQAWFYFDPETYRHVRSQFKLEIPASASTRITDSAEMVRYQIIERFDQFKDVDGLTLPHSHNIEFSVDSPRGGLVTTWAHSIDRIVHDEAIESQIFSLR
jgi:hypothetical protein